MKGASPVTKNGIGHRPSSMDGEAAVTISLLYHRYVSILKYNTAGVCLAIKKAMPVNGHRLFDYERTRCNGDHGKIGSPYRQPSPQGEGLGGATLRVDFYKGRCPKTGG